MADWTRRLESALADLEATAAATGYRQSVQDLGRVRRVGDGIAAVEGLSEAMLDEMVVFANGVTGQILDLDRELASCIIYGAESGIEAGSEVFRTGQAAMIPTGIATLGRIMDPLGEPVDDLGPIESGVSRAVESDAPGVLQRQAVHEPLLTGIKAIDAAVPIGLGQRELILGDRETGKTSIAVDTIVNQRDREVLCVYVAIGGRRASVRELMEELRRADAVSHLAVIVADASAPAALRYLAPYAGASLAESFAYSGRHVLVVYDDLTRHAEAYRDISLLLRRPPGRDAYPSDIFSAHARLLERAFKLSDSLGGGSVTALPIIETQRGNIADYIPTNLISITDGQLFLDAGLFAEGRLPAIDIGRSISRVGGGAQPAAMRDVSQRLRLELAQYEEVKGFARFGAILDESTKRQLERGQRVTSVLQQPERYPVPLAVEVAVLFALKVGLLDDVPVPAIAAFEAALAARLPEFAHLAAALPGAPALDASLEQGLRAWIAAAKEATATLNGSSS